MLNARHIVAHCPEQEKCQGRKSVGKDEHAKHGRVSGKEKGENGENHGDVLVADVRDKVEHGNVRGEVEEEGGELDDDQLEKDCAEARARGHAKYFGCEPEKNE